MNESVIYGLYTLWLRASAALWPGHYCELENPELSGPSSQHKSWNSVTFSHFFLSACSTAAALFALVAAPTSGLRNLARSMCLCLPLTDGATVEEAAAALFSIFVLRECTRKKCGCSMCVCICHPQVTPQLMGPRVCLFCSGPLVPSAAASGCRCASRRSGDPRSFVCVVL